MGELYPRKPRSVDNTSEQGNTATIRRMAINQGESELSQEAAATIAIVVADVLIAVFTGALAYFNYRLLRVAQNTAKAALVTAETAERSFVSSRIPLVTAKWDVSRRNGSLFITGQIAEVSGFPTLVHRVQTRLADDQWSEHSVRQGTILFKQSYMAIHVTANTLTTLELRCVTSMYGSDSRETWGLLAKPIDDPDAPRLVGEPARRIEESGGSFNPVT